MTASTSDRTATSLVAVGVLIVLVAALVAVLAGGEDAPASTFDLATVAAPTVDGPSLPTDPDRAAGSAAPRVAAPSLLTDAELALPAGDGNATMIVFLAHWCSHCNAEVPVIVDWLATDPLPDDVAVVTVATGIDPTAPNYPPDAWLRERGWTLPTLVDVDRSIGDAYGVTSYPAWVFVDADGLVLGTGGAQTAASLDAAVTALSTGSGTAS